MKLLYKKNENLSNELNEKEKLFGENLGKNEVNVKLLEDYKNKLNNLKKENSELNKNNILINENNEKLKTNIKLNTDEIEQLKNQIEKELLPKIKNYETQINVLTKENKSKEILINNNASLSSRMNVSLNKNMEEIKNLKSEKEQSVKEIEVLNKEINLLKIKLLDKEKEISKLKEEIKNINDDNTNQKDEFNNEINILNSKLSNQQSSNEDYIKKIEGLNTKIKNLQNENNKYTQKNTELLNEVLSYKDKINGLNEANQKLKIENDSQQKTLMKLTSLSKDDNEAKKNALIAVKETNKKITEYLLMLNNKENEIKSLKDENFKYKNEINELNNQLKNKSNIESQIDELKQQQNQAINVNSETNTKLNILSSNCDDIGNTFNKFQQEIETIQTMINNNKNNDKNIDLSNLFKIIDEENEDIESEMSVTNNSKKGGSGEKRSDLNNSKNKKIKKSIRNKPMELCMNNINEKVNEAKSRFLSLINSYYNSLTHINKKIKEKQKIHNSVIDLSNKLLKEILPQLENLDKLGEHYEKKINKSKSDDEIIFYLNRLINDIINKLKETSNNLKEEIDRLHKRIDFFIQQNDNMKRTQEILAQEERKNHKRQIQIKEEELNKIKEEMNYKDKYIDEGKRKNIDLSDELQDMKKKYNIKEKDIEIIENRTKEEKKKNAIKDLNTAKYAINDFIGKVRQFVDDLYVYSDMKSS
jgi:chromosome segregation ATPase